MAWDFWKQKKKKVTAYVVFGAIILVFVFLRYNDWNERGAAGYAAFAGHETEDEAELVVGG